MISKLLTLGMVYSFVALNYQEPLGNKQKEEVPRSLGQNIPELVLKNNGAN